MKSKLGITLVSVGCMSWLGLGGCGDDFKQYPHRFSIGDVVQMKLDGRKGMVIRTYNYHDGLEVRFAATTETTTAPFLGGSHDIEVSPYKVTFVREIELEPAKP